MFQFKEMDINLAGSLRIILFQDGLREEELLQHMKSVHIEGAIQVNILFKTYFNLLELT